MMKKYIMIMLLVFGCAFILMACSNDEDNERHDSNNQENTASNIGGDSNDGHMTSSIKGDGNKGTDSNDDDHLSPDYESPDSPGYAPPSVPNWPEVHFPDEIYIEEDDGDVTLHVPDPLLFELDKSDLKTEAEQILDEVAVILKEYDDVDVEINGHTDNTGDKDYNLNLSEKRADSVKDYLDEQGALAKVIVSTNGFGDTKSIASNNNEEGQQKNRRVEVVLKGLDE